MEAQTVGLGPFWDRAGDYAPRLPHHYIRLRAEVVADNDGRAALSSRT